MNLNKKIMAIFDDKTIRVYQAYNHKIADEALKLGTFGPSFKLERMTWIKPSFLWMMYRSGWGTKKDQEKILAIDISRNGFDEILSNAVLSTYTPEIYPSYDIWKVKLKESEVRCQWDPGRDIYGNPMNDRAIQLGLSGSMVKKYVNEWIYKITDISSNVLELYKKIQQGYLPLEYLPKENEYALDQDTKRILGIISEE